MLMKVRSVGFHIHTPIPPPFFGSYFFGMLSVNILHNIMPYLKPESAENSYIHCFCIYFFSIFKAWICLFLRGVKFFFLTFWVLWLSRVIYLFILINIGDSIFCYSLQSLCGLSSTWHSMYVDWLYHMLWELCKYGRWMWLLGRCQWSRTTIIVHNGNYCAGTVYFDWYIL